MALFALPAPAAAQRDPFFSAVVAFYRASAGLYGDEGPQLTSQLTAMTAALARWDMELGEAERQLRSRLESAGDVETKLQIHTTLASLYIERGRFSDAVREFDEDIRLDPRRAAFHRLKGLVLQAMPPGADAAEAFRSAWLLDPEDRQNAYRLIAERSPATTPQDIERARDTLAKLEGELIRRERPATPAPFPNLRAIVDDAGGGMAFVPAVYAGGISLILQGELDRGVAALRSAIAVDPLVTDSAARSESMARGIAALRQAASGTSGRSATGQAALTVGPRPRTDPSPEGLVAAAVEALEAAVAGAKESSEARRILATAYSITGNITATVQQLREAMALNPRDERSRLALAQTLTAVGRSAESEDVLRAAVAELPDASALRWKLSTGSQAEQGAADRALIEMADRLALLVGKGELYRALAGLAELHLDDDMAISLLQRAVRLTPNNAAAHKALGRAYVESGRDAEGYAELVIALLLNADEVETLTALGRWHLTAEQPERAVAALERAVAVEPANRLAVHALAGALLRVGRVSEGKQRLQESERLQAQAIEDDRRAKAAAVLRLDAGMRMAAGDHAGAVDVWRQAIQLQPGTAAVHLRLAEALVTARRPDEGVAEYRTAIALKAGAEAHRRLAELYDALGRSADAARERAAHVERRLEELRQRAAQGAYGL